MSAQPLTTELRDWILAQTAAGQSSEALVESMRASGWTDAAARCALQETGREPLDSALHAAVAGPPTPVPDPLAAGNGLVLEAGDRAVRVLVSMHNPRVIVFGGLLSDDECDEMIELSRQRLARSETVQTETGSSEVNAARTSDGMFFARGEFALCARIEGRIAALLRWPVENGEGLQVLRYRAGAEYKPHYDYFDPAQAGTSALLRRGGQRVASLICYLNSPDRGGSTVFPDVGLEVAPIKGNAVFFSYDRPHPGTCTLHGGAAVQEGEKWVATKWVRERRFD
jgi:prolyl 4-hydroxylase